MDAKLERSKNVCIVVPFLIRDIELINHTLGLYCEQIKKSDKTHDEQQEILIEVLATQKRMRDSLRVFADVNIRNKTK